MSAPAPERPRIGVSECLLGHPVRYDGGHRRDRFIWSRLSQFAELVPICPEVESGLPVPRESMRLVQEGEVVRLRGNRSGRDHTGTVRGWAERRAAELTAEKLDGFLLTRGSPSCGLARVPVYRDDTPVRDGTGLFAATLRQALPWLPIAEAGWLQDDGLRESFLDGVFTHHRLERAVASGGGAHALVDFQADHKLLYLAHSPEGMRQLGRLVASAASRPLEETVATYRLYAAQTLRVKTSRGKHVNALLHILGYFRTILDVGEKEELLELIEEYRAGLHRLAVPLTLLKHHLRRRELGGWLSRQVYFEPFPRALGPR